MRHLEAITEGLVSAEQTIGDIPTEYLVKRKKEVPPEAFPRYSAYDLWYPVIL